MDFEDEVGAVDDGATADVSVDAGPADGGAAEVDPLSTAAAEVIASWNGELDSLSEQPWYSAADEAARNAIREGLRGKISNLERGFHTKLGEFRTRADARRTELESEYNGRSEKLDQRAEFLDKREREFMRLLTGDSDLQVTVDEYADRRASEKMIELRLEIDRLNKAIEGTIDAGTKSELESALQKEREARAAAEGILNDLFKMKQEAEDKEAEAEAESTIVWLQENAPDVLDSDEAFEAFLKFADAGNEKALRHVRVEFPEPAAAPAAAAPEPAKPPEPKPVPKSQDLASKRSGPSVAPVGSTGRRAEDVLAEMRQRAARQAGSIR